MIIRTEIELKERMDAYEKFVEIIRKYDEDENEIFRIIRENRIKINEKYQENGKKTTRVLLKELKKNGVNNAEKIVSDYGKLLEVLYKKYEILIGIRPAFRALKKNLLGKYGDENSCFRISGQNDGHTTFLLQGHDSWETLYITIRNREDKENDRGRLWAILDYENERMLLFNIYVKGKFENYGKVVILEEIAKIMKNLFCYEKIEDTRIELPIYLNGDMIILYNHEEKKRKPILAKCPICGDIAELVKGEDSYEVELSRLKYIDSDIKDLWIEKGERTMGNLPLCRECILEYTDNEEYYYCDSCGREMTEDEYYTLPDGAIVCEYCFYRVATYCHRCGETIWNEDAYYAYNNAYCDLCFDRSFAVCDECDEGIYKNEIVTVYDRHPDYDNLRVCKNCLENLIERGIVKYDRDENEYYLTKKEA